MLSALKNKSLFNLAGLFLAWLIVFGLFSYLLPDSFPTLRNVETLARQGTIVSLAALGMTLVIVSGGLDLSVGSVVALVTVVVAWCLKNAFEPWIALFAGLAAGCACGLINGMLVTRLKVGPFIVTLGTLLLFRGLAKGLAKEQKIDAPDSWLSNLIATLGPEERWQLLPVGVWLLLIFALLVSGLLNRTVFGRHATAIGANETAARYSGIAVGRTKLLVYIFMGLFAGLAGLMQFSRLTVGDPTVATGLELDVIAAVVIGGASLSGGYGSVLGSLLGALIMTTIRSGGSQLGLPNWIQEIVTGAIIILAVALDRLRVKVH